MSTTLLPSHLLQLDTSGMLFRQGDWIDVNNTAGGRCEGAEQGLLALSGPGTA